MLPFDPAHSRCLFPIYAATFDAAMRHKKLTASTIARALGIDPSAVALWRRGFGRNAPSRTAHLEALLGVKLPFDEPVPSARVTAAHDEAPEQRESEQDPVLPHLEAIARAHGYSAIFVPL